MLTGIIMGVLYVLAAAAILFYAIAAAGFVNRPGIPKTGKFPKVSAIIAAKDEESVLEGALKALKKSDYPDMEIIVVASGSATAKIAGKYADKVLVDRKPSGKPGALNLGVKKAGGEILYFLDADCVVRRDTIRNLVSSIDGEHPAAAGIVVPRRADNFISLAAALQTVWLHIANYGLPRIIGTAVIPGRNFAVLKKALAGGFRNVLTEDLNLSRRLHAAGKKVAFVPQAACSETYPKKFSDYFRQQERWHAGFFAEQGGMAKELGPLKYILVVAAGAILAEVHLVVLTFSILYALTGSVLFAYAAIIPAAVMIATAAMFLKRRVYYLPALFVANAALEVAFIACAARKSASGEKIPWNKTPRQ